MLGALITFAFCAGVAGCGLFVFRKWLSGMDPAVRLGLAGLFSLGLLGTALLFFGLVQGGLRVAMLFAWLAVVAGAVYLVRRRAEFGLSLPQGPRLMFPAILALCLLMAFIGSLAPPDMNEWDSLAYHLAVPKMWLQAGRIYYIPFTHHSNFPFAIDNLFLLGLQWGAHSGAKAFVLALSVFGGLTVFGLTRQVYGRTAGWWSALAFATVPVVMWLSGTAYVDVPNGLYAGLGIVLAGTFLREPADRRPLWLAAVSLGLAAGSKYTGLQTLAVVGIVLFGGLAYRRRGADFARYAIPAGILAAAIAFPWYAKNASWTGNPVYPFFYSRFDGRNWDEKRAEIYSNEQQTFGVGRTESRRDISQIGHAVLGLAYQPGRYVNPMQQTGGGTPLGAVGVAVISAMAAWALSGRARSLELSCLAAVALSFLLWFFLSQQSRYIISLAVPLAVLLGGGIARLRAGPLLATATAAQALYSIWLVKTSLTDAQVQVVSGKVNVQDYLSARAPFSEAAAEINGIVPPNGRVALYDEVFGYFLDVPYFWANPGHSTVIPYERMERGIDFAREMRSLGFTHVYVNLLPMARPRDLTRRWMQAMGIAGAVSPLPEQERQALMRNWEQRYMPLIAEAAGERHLVPVKGFRSGVLFEIRSTGDAGGNLLPPQRQ